MGHPASDLGGHQFPLARRVRRSLVGTLWPSTVEDTGEPLDGTHASEVWGGYTAAGLHLWPTHPLINSPSYILRAPSARTGRGNGPGVISGGKCASKSRRGRQVRGAARRPCPCVVGAPGGSLGFGGVGGAGRAGRVPRQLPRRQHPTLPFGGRWESVTRGSDRLGVHGDCPTMITAPLDSNEETRCHNESPEHVKAALVAPRPHGHKSSSHGPDLRPYIPEGLVGDMNPKPCDRGGVP